MKVVPPAVQEFRNTFDKPDYMNNQGILLRGS